MGIRGVDDDVHKRLVDLGNGVIVERDVNNTVIKLREYDPNIVVQYCDPALADLGDAPYRIMELCPDGMRRVIMEVWELDDRVLERIHELDKHRVDLLSELDKANFKAKDLQARRYKEEIASITEMAKAVLDSPKDTYRATNPVTGQRHKFTNVRQSD